MGSPRVTGTIGSDPSLSMSLMEPKDESDEMEDAVETGRAEAKRLKGREKLRVLDDCWSCDESARKRERERVRFCRHAKRKREDADSRWKEPS